VKQGDTPGSVAILESCAEACRSRGLSFQQLVQESSIQGHTPLYWAIINHSLAPPPVKLSGGSNNTVTLFDMLTSFPLNMGTYDDALQACISTSSHDAFLQLQKHDPALQDPTSGFDRTINEPAFVEDTVEVTNGVEQEAIEESALSGAFLVNIVLQNFQRRMRIHGRIIIQFVARGEFLLSVADN
jgi:hypothetical protein